MGVGFQALPDSLAVWAQYAYPSPPKLFFLDPNGATSFHMFKLFQPTFAHDLSDTWTIQNHKILKLHNVVTWL